MHLSYCNGEAFFPHFLKILVCCGVRYLHNCNSESAQATCVKAGNQVNKRSYLKFTSLTT
uniref:Uncharacterized protein n=1 Tax=Anguilla anguilla TaxID=7936 RepID=A0A0E9ST01_ANGAN